MSAAKGRTKTAPRLKLLPGAGLAVVTDAFRGMIQARISKAMGLRVGVSAYLDGLRTSDPLVVSGSYLAAAHVSWICQDAGLRLEELMRKFDFDTPDPDMFDAGCIASAAKGYGAVVAACLTVDTSSGSFRDGDDAHAAATLARMLADELAALETAIDAANPEG